MRRGWKRLAKRSANGAFDDAERSQAVAEALEEDFRAEVRERFVGRLRRVLDDSHDDLFGESATERLESLRGEAAHGPLAGMVLDHAIQAVHEGGRGEEALETAVRNALQERAASGQRQVEEHWLRESSAWKAKLLGNRIGDAISDTEMGVIARRCIGSSGDRAPRGPVRKIWDRRWRVVGMRMAVA